MKNYIKHIDDFFREKLGSYTEAPPAEAWDELQGRLDTLKPQSPKNPYRRLGHFAIISVILLLSVSVIKKYANSNSTGSQLAQNVTTAASTTTSNIGNNSAKIIEHDSNNASNNQSQQSENVSNRQENKNIVNGSDNEEHSAAARPAVIAGKATVKGAGQKKTNGKSLPQARTIAGHSGTASGPNAEEEQQENTYNAAAKTPADKKSTDSKADSKKKTEEPIVKKTEPAINKQAIKEKEAAKQVKKSQFTHLEVGVKMGYETSVTDWTISKYVLSPYVKYNISKKVALMVQPGIKYANMPRREIASQSYYNINDDGRVDQPNPTEVHNTTVGGTTKTEFVTTYVASQSHDSIVKSYRYGGSYMEFELPVLVSYKLSSSLSAYGGINLIYSQMTNITESSNRVKGIQRTESATITADTMPTRLPLVNEIIKYNGIPYSSYTGALYTAPQQGVLRIGYTLGFSYEYNKQWMFDAITQISPIKPIMKGGYDVNTPLSSPYFRLSVGYKLKK